MKKARPRQEVMNGMTSKVELLCGNLYVTVNTDENDNPFEVFLQLGKAGGCGYSQLEALARTISLSLRSGVALTEVSKQLKGIRCPQQSFSKGKTYFSCADAVAIALDELNELVECKKTNTCEISK